MLFGVALLATALLAVAFQGFWLFAQPYPAPPEPLRPTMAGVIESGLLSGDGDVVTLQDGTTVDIPGTYKQIGGGDQKGNLLLSGTNGGGFVAVLLPDRRYDGCWEAWEDFEDPIAWDMGDSILFLNRLALPKAPGYHVDPEPHTVNGHLAWTDPTNGSMPQWMSFCANAKGQIEWGQKNP
jgi:hypothetical protein